MCVCILTACQNFGASGCSLTTALNYGGLHQVPQAHHRLRLTHHMTSQLSRCDLIVNLAVVVNLVLCKDLIIHYFIVGLF